MSAWYRLLAKEDVAEYAAVARYYEHTRSGAHLLHLHNDDPENLFAFCFMTPPADSTGIAHILEHTVLCGSRHFPLKDPFLQLVKGSVQSFLNAMTFPDRTIYPAASAVRADLFNIMRVYGDAVFYPLLQREMFMQEGHHITIDQKDAPGISGVVYNEMIGASATHDHVTNEWSYRGLLPETVYRHSSGGDPKEIPRLDYQDFVDFYHTYYHPSNSLIVLYGNIPTHSYLRFLHRRFLRHFRRGTQDRPVIESQRRWSDPRTLVKSFPYAAEGDPARQSSITISWLLDDVQSGYDILLAEVISEILIGTSGAPLYKAILDSPLGEDLSSSSGVESELKQLIFSVGIRGTEEKQSKKVTALIYDTLTDIVKNGIDPLLLEGALFKIEFSTREIKRLEGLRILRRVVPGWMYRHDPLATLSVEQALATLKKNISENDRYIEEYITKKLLENPHNLTLIVNPDTAQAESERAERKKALQEKSARMSAKERARIIERNQALAAIQQKPESASERALIPHLKIRDMPKKARVIEHTRIDWESIPLLYIPQHTNDIDYLTFAMDMSCLTMEELRYVPFLTTALTEMGTRTHDYVQLSQLIQRHFGGLYASAGLYTDMHDPTSTTLSLVLHVKTLRRELSMATEILIELLTKIDFSNAQRYSQILAEETNEMRSAIIPSAHIFAGRSAVSTINPIGMIQERWRGVSQLKFLRQITAKTDIDMMQAVYRKIMSGGISVAAISAHRQELPPVQDALNTVRAAIEAAFPTEAHPSSPIDGVTELNMERTHRKTYTIPSGGNYVAYAIPSTHLGKETIDDYVAESILARTLTTGVLWESIRMQGGAYGASASVGIAPGTFCFTSYRDPHVAHTLEKFEQALEHAACGKLSKSEINQTIVALTGQENTPHAPSDKINIVFSRHISNYSAHLRQAIHHAYLTCSPEKVVRVAKRLYDSLTDRKIAVIGEPDSVRDAQKKYINAIPTIESLTL